MQRKNWPTARNWWSGRVRAFHLIWLSWPRNESSENRSKDYVSDVNIYWSTSKHLGSWKKQQPWRYICIHIHFIYIIWGYSVHSIDRMLRLYSCYEMKIESHSETVLRCDIAKWNKNQKQGSSTEWHKKKLHQKIVKAYARKCWKRTEQKFKTIPWDSTLLSMIVERDNPAKNHVRKLPNASVFHFIVITKHSHRHYLNNGPHSVRAQTLNRSMVPDEEVVSTYRNTLLRFGRAQSVKIVNAVVQSKNHSL